MKRPKIIFNSKMAENVSKKSDENIDATEIIRQGTRAYIIRDYKNAVQMLSTGIEIFVNKYGEKYDSLGEVYLNYGKSLLELSREESDPLGDAVPRELKTGESDSTDDDDDEVEEEEEGAAETAEEKGKEQDKPEEAKIEDEKIESDDKPKPDEAEKKEINGSEEDKVETTEATAGSSGAAKPDEKGEDITGEEVEDDNPTDLQLAWEVLELAKIIFKARGEDGESHLADTLVSLGEVAMESENFESAINDIKEGLQIQQRVCDQYSRRISETYYKLGIAYSANNQLDEAIDYYVKSHATLVDRVVILEKDTPNNQDELTELRELIPEIYEKILDTRNLKNEIVKQKTAEEKQQKENVNSAAEKQINDISHLVKRKRATLDPIEEGESPAKKPSP